MGRLLIVAYTYPPLATVGAIRPLTLAREASQNGWDVNVLTVAADYAIPRDYSVRSPVKTTRATRIPLSYFTRWLRYPLKGKGILWSFMDYQYDWVPTAVAAGNRLYKKWPYDVVWATAPPFSALRVGVKLAERHNVPSVADLRDPFINNITRDFLHPWIREFWSRYYYKLLSRFDRRIVVDDCIIEELRSLDYSLIRNGYDEDEFLRPSPERFQNFTVGFVGSVYKELEIEPLFLAFGKLPEEVRRNSRLLFVGKGSDLAARYAKKHGIKQFEARPVVPRTEAIDIMKRCHVLVWFGANAVGTKIYEYAQTGAMSLQIYNSDDQHSYLFAEEYGLSHNVRADRIDDIAELLLEAYKGNHYDYTKHLKKFTRKTAAKDILRVIEEVVK